MSIFDGIDRTLAPPFNMTPPTREELLAALEEGCRQVREMAPRPPCGTEKRPHLTAPAKPGDVRRCVACGAVGTLP